MFTHAIVREPGKNFAQGITTAKLGEPDYDKMVHQHQAYIQALESLGLEVIVLNAEPDYPDAYFVEDVAVVSPEIAVITNPGAQARKGEQDSIEPVLAQFRPTVRIQAPGTVDGGDVLMVGRHFYIGVSERTNLEGATQLGHILENYGNTWTPVEVAAGLHLKSGVNYVGKGILLVSESFDKREVFKGYTKILVPTYEAYAANTLWINDHLIMPLGFPETKKRLADIGLPIIELDASEAQKMDGGLTCMSLRIQ
jgi:dimethylargininase